MIKREQVYNVFALWMLGQKVEVGIYRNLEDGELGSPPFIGRTAGTLAEYAEGSEDSGGKLIWRFAGATETESVNDRETYHILISVLEP